MESLSGAIIDQKYRITRLLGEGGMGAVYEAIQLSNGHLVALKVLHTTLGDPAARARFEREARALSELRHESLVRVLDYSARGEHSYFVMELAPGLHLSALTAKDGPLQPERVAKIALAVLGALDVAHGCGIIHRDVKPQNIQVSPFSGGGDAVRLLDFGLAKDLSGRPQHALTEAGVVVGTMQYMAPEQAQASKLDARVDLYAVGTCMYLALTGRRPFEGQTGLGLYRAVLSGKPMPLIVSRAGGPGLPAALVAIVERAMEKDRTKRFGSAREMAHAIASYLASSHTSHTGHTSHTPPPLARSTPNSAGAHAGNPSAGSRSPHWGRTVPLSAIPFASQPPASGADLADRSDKRSTSGSDALLWERPVSTPPPAADTPVPSTIPNTAPASPEHCPPTQRSGKGTMLAGLFVLLFVMVTGGAVGAAVQANAPARIYAAIPR